MHALREFINDYPEIDKEWYESSNYLCLLSVDNENELLLLITKLSKANIRFSLFREPDIGNQITAIAVEPGKHSKRICSSLSLALSTNK